MGAALRIADGCYNPAVSGQTKQKEFYTHRHRDIYILITRVEKTL